MNARAHEPTQDVRGLGGQLGEWIPLGYDVYAIGLQECNCVEQLRCVSSCCLALRPPRVALTPFDPRLTVGDSPPTVLPTPGTRCTSTWAAPRPTRCSRARWRPPRCSTAPSP